MAQKDYYLILGVSRTETTRGIQKAFRELAKQYHPDRVGPEGTAAFQEIVEAYEVLSDPARRRKYNELLLQAESRQPAPEPISVRYRPQAEPLTSKPLRRYESGWREPWIGDPLSLFQDFWTITPSFDALWERMLRNFTGRGVPKSEHAEALNVQVVLSPEEARHGGVIRLGVPVFTPCTNCAGSGYEWEFICRICAGQGMIEREAMVPVRIPPGVFPGTILEIPLSEWGIYNLYLRVHIEVTAWR